MRFKPASAEAQPPGEASATPGAAPETSPEAGSESASGTAPTARTNAATPARSSDGSGRKVLGWSAIGLGAAGVVTGVVVGAAAMSKKSALDDSGQCVGSSCLRSSALDEYGTFRTVSSIGFIAGGALAAVGVVLLVTAPSGDSASARAGTWLRVSSSGVTAGGRF